MDEPRPIEFDDRFAIKISENMELRNLLRSGLVDAQGPDSDKIPMFVSWPDWLEEGIVCLYSRDLHALLKKTVQETAEALAVFIDRGDESGESPLNL